MAKKSTAFPVGLYGMLLFALLWLTLPAVFAPLERLLVGAVCIVPRVASRFFGEPAVAARRADLRRIDELGAVLHRRVERHDFAGAGMSMAAGAAPVLCSVLSVQRRGGAGLPSELLLDHSYRELAGCGEIVTKGPTLLGFLQRPGVGVAADDLPDDPARVLLCHHRRAPRLYAGLEQPDGSRLHFVVRSSASVDPAPLRVDLWDDPYRAAKLGRAGQQVFTLPLSFGEQRVPGGLLLGRTRIWGYEQPDSDEQLTIGVFVVPPIEPRALSHVVLWREHDVTPGNRIVVAACAPTAVGDRLRLARRRARPPSAGRRRARAGWGGGRAERAVPRQRARARVRRRPGDVVRRVAPVLEPVVSAGWYR